MIRYNNVTLSQIYNLYPKGTSCIFTEYKLYKNNWANETNLYSHEQVKIIPDVSKVTNDSISMLIDTATELNERPWIQATTRGKQLS